MTVSLMHILQAFDAMAVDLAMLMMHDSRLMRQG